MNILIYYNERTYFKF